MGEKITDIRREIKSIQLQREISQIADLKINLKKDYEGIVKESVEKVADCIIRPIFLKDLPIDETISEVVAMVSDSENLSVAIETVLTDYERNLGIEVIHHRNFTRKDRPEKGEISPNSIVKIIITDTAGGRIEYISSTSLKLRKSIRQQWKLKSCTSWYYFYDMSEALAEVYIANQLTRYMDKNKELSVFTLLTEVQQIDCVDNERQLQMINELNEKYNLPQLEGVKVQPGKMQGSSLNYVGWLFEYLEGKRILQINNLYQYNEKKGKLALERLSYEGYKKLYLFLKQMCTEMEEITREVVRKEREASEYASAYETKKNVPQKILEKMQDNKFLKWFGYVEFDEEIDMAKVGHIEEEFVEFAEYINLSLYKDHSFRFKKLGKHRADGIYFPDVKCVCVDLQGIDSTVHEVLHVIDYNTLQQCRLSDLYNFRSIIERYRYLVVKAIDMLPEEDPIKRGFYGKNKYNYEYYFSHTEIFARTGEIYFHRIKELDNSILGLCDNVYYPDDNILKEMIGRYFKTIFGELGVNRKTDPRITACSGGSHSRASILSMEVRERDDGQLTFLD